MTCVYDIYNVYLNIIKNIEIMMTARFIHYSKKENKEMNAYVVYFKLVKKAKSYKEDLISVRKSLKNTSLTDENKKAALRLEKEFKEQCI